MELMPGYKLSDVGVIPEDWGVSTLGQVCSFENGDRSSNYPSPGAFRQSGIPFINAGHVSEGKVSLSEMNYITQEAYARLGGGKVKAGDILFCLRGSLGKFGVVSDSFGLGAIASSLVIVRPKAAALSLDYLSCYFSSSICSQMIATWAGGAAQPNLGAKELARFSIPLPPSLTEQRAIAQALRDVDTLLATLDQVIAKKRDLKQATMQQLLTGKTRLPGFHGEWNILPAREIGFFKGGSGFPLSAQGETEGEYPFFKVSDMNNEGNETFMTAANHYVSEQTRTRLGATAFPADSIVFAKVGAAVFLERKKILGQASCIDNNMAAFVLDKSRVDVGYIHALLLSKKLSALVTTTALPALNAKQLGEMLLAVPPLPEQSTIADVLSEMDAELIALESRRDKTRNIKQAMMQELLTGKTRLIAKEESHV